MGKNLRGYQAAKSGVKRPEGHAAVNPGCPRSRAFRDLGVL